MMRNSRRWRLFMPKLRSYLAHMPTAWRLLTSLEQHYDASNQASGILLLGRGSHWFGVSIAATGAWNVGPSASTALPSSAPIHTPSSTPFHRANCARRYALDCMIGRTGRANQRTLIGRWAGGTKRMW